MDFKTIYYKYRKKNRKKRKTNIIMHNTFSVKAIIIEIDKKPAFFFNKHLAVDLI